MMDTLQCAKCNTSYDVVNMAIEGNKCPDCGHDDYNFRCDECRCYFEWWLYFGVCPDCDYEGGE